MNCRRLVSSFLVVFSIALGALLAGLLAKFAGLGVPSVVKLVGRLHPDSLATITLLLAANGFFAAEKWRLIDRCLSDRNRPEMPRLLYFAFTSIGVGLGQIVPAQLSLLACRSIGAHLYGRRALLRGTAATLIDQLFDLAIAIVAALSSGMVLAANGAAGIWLAGTMVLCVAGWFALPVIAQWAARAAGWAGARYPRRTAAFESALGALLRLPAVARRLWLFSAARFVVLVLIGVTSAQAAATDIPAWHLAASLPFAVIGNALAVTPGGLGVNEWAVSSALVAFGTPFQSAAQWAIVNRIYVVLAAMLGGIFGFVIIGLARTRRAATPG